MTEIGIEFGFIEDNGKYILIIGEIEFCCRKKRCGIHLNFSLNAVLAVNYKIS